jgi:hypothetical protein
MMSNGRRFPRNGVPTPPRGPRPEGFRSYGSEYEQSGAGQRADGAGQRPPRRPGQGTPHA